MTKNITDVQCPSCGAPAEYDIKKAFYACHYCEGKVSVKDAQLQKSGFRKLHQQKIKTDSKKYALVRANCTGCGAVVVFEENNALAKCAFCGKALVRKDYLNTGNVPELIIPFKITKEEAAVRISDWCRKNSFRKEARLLRRAGFTLSGTGGGKSNSGRKNNSGETTGLFSEGKNSSTEGFTPRDIGGESSSFTGCYLPYELVKGPVGCTVTRLEEGNEYYCEGYIDEVFVNTSSQLNNMLLDGMEPYNLSELSEFDFAYVAGHQVKFADVKEKELEKRVCDEIEKEYAPAVRKVLETKAVSVDAATGSVLRLPVLLPAYYFSCGDLIASVNGQTGKVSVQALKNSYYFFTPWWLKAIFWTLVTIGITAGVMFSLKAEKALILEVMAFLGFITIIVMLTAFGETARHKYWMKKEKKIFTSKGGPFVRNVESKKLVQEKKPLKKKVVPPVFTETLDGKDEFVVLRFTSFIRVLDLVIKSAVILFFPVIIALFVNGFHFKMLNLGGSAVWFCIVVPILPVYIVKFCIMDLYDNPWIYIIKENGHLKLYRKKRAKIEPKKVFEYIKIALFEKPYCIISWIGLLLMVTMVYLTAFGDW